MKPILSVESLALQPNGSILSLELLRGQSACVLGPGGAGKSRLLRVLAGLEKPASGSVTVAGKRAMALEVEVSRKATPLAIAKHASGQNNSRAADAIGGMRLGDSRNTPLADLSPTQQAAASMLHVLASPAHLLLIDALLDRLDPWALDGALRLLRGQLSHGASLVISTHRPDLLPLFDSMIVLDRQEVRFHGALEEVLRRIGSSEVEVETRNPASAKAMAGPLEVSVTPTADGLLLNAPEGQELAAKLLTEGYGDVKAVILREPTVREGLLDLI
ncbi:MAG: ATP-binding cassette domain-containing protein [Fimbriimonadaceae bacterium]